MKIFSFDVKTDKSYPFAIAAIVYEKGEEVDRFLARLPDNVVGSEWTKLTVLKAISNIEPTHVGYEGMIRDFASFYKKHYDAHIIAHMGHFQEAHLLREMFQLGLLDVIYIPQSFDSLNGLLLAAGENPMDIYGYVDKHNLEVKDSPHNPLCYCEMQAKVFMHLMERFSA